MLGILLIVLVIVLLFNGAQATPLVAGNVLQLLLLIVLILVLCDVLGVGGSLYHLR